MAINDAQDNVAPQSQPSIVQPDYVTDTPTFPGAANASPRVLARQIPPSMARGVMQLGGSNIFVDSASQQIRVNDDTTDRVEIGAIGTDSSGATQWGMKVSKPGVDVTTASDDELVFNSQQNIFKIAKTVLYDYTVTNTDITNTYFSFTVRHGLGFAPQVMASFKNTADGTIRLLPLNYLDLASAFASTLSATVTVDKVDSTNIYVKTAMFDAVGASFFVANTSLKFTFYCEVETAG